MYFNHSKRYSIIDVIIERKASYLLFNLYEQNKNTIINIINID